MNNLEIIVGHSKFVRNYKYNKSVSVYLTVCLLMNTVKSGVLGIINVEILEQETINKDKMPLNLNSF